MERIIMIKRGCCIGRMRQPFLYGADWKERWLSKSKFLNKQYITVDNCSQLLYTVCIKEG